MTGPRALPAFLLEDSAWRAALHVLDAPMFTRDQRVWRHVDLDPIEPWIDFPAILAEGGLPKGGGVGYEIFDKSDALGTTSFVQNINHLRALEGELARTIRAIDRIQAARVHLVLPERPLFAREAPEPSASIVVRSASGSGLAVCAAAGMAADSASASVAKRNAMEPERFFLGVRIFNDTRRYAARCAGALA